MTGLLVTLALFFAAMLQTHLPGVDILGHAKAPLFLSVVIYYALRRDALTLFGVAALGGLLQDGTSAVPLGYSSVCFLVLAWIIWRVREQLVTDAAVTQMVLGGAAGGLITLIQYLWLLQAGLIAVSPLRALYRALGDGLLGVVVTPLVCLLLIGVDRGVGNVKVSSEV